MLYVLHTRVKNSEENVTFCEIDFIFCFTQKWRDVQCVRTYQELLINVVLLSMRHSEEKQNLKKKMEKREEEESKNPWY